MDKKDQEQMASFIKEKRNAYGYIQEYVSEQSRNLIQLLHKDRERISDTFPGYAATDCVSLESLTG